MPAIQLARLKVMTVQLADAFSQPALFKRRLYDLLDFYADRTYRPGQTGRSLTLLPHYRVAPPVMRQIELELSPLCAAHPQEALELADLIWAEGYLETRLLAVYLLSQVPSDPPEPVIAHIRAWARPEEDNRVLSALLSSGNSHFQRERPDLWLEIIQKWLDDMDTAILGLGLRALLSLANDPGYENLPVIFRLLTRAMQVIPSILQADYLDLIEALARRSPRETAYLLRQSIHASHDATTARLVRKCLPFFAQDLQGGLRSALLNRAKE